MTRHIRDSPTFTVAGLAILAVLVSCGSDDNEEGCGTLEEPVILTIRDVEPAQDTTVTNDAIVHGFTVIDAPGAFGQTTSRLLSDHTAGAFDPSQLVVTVRSEGSDIRYELSPLVWANAPAHVEFEIAETFRDQSDCFWRLPSPLFSYDVVAPSQDGGLDGGVDGTPSDLGLDGEMGDAGGDGG
jgi:hypothetical protein